MRKSNATHRLWQLARWGGVSSWARQIASLWPFPVLTNVQGSRPLYVDLRSSIGRGLFATGQFDIEAIRPALNVLGPGSVFLDVGANIGYYSFLALEKVGLTGAVHSFECGPPPLRALKRSIQLHRPANLFLEEFAVWNSDGEVEFASERESGHSHIASRVERGVAVTCRSLDSWVRERDIKRVDVLKIDVEGCELQVLEGGREMLASHHPLIVCELDATLTRRFGYEPSRLIQVLGEMGYQTEAVVGAFSPTIVARYGA